MLDKSIRLELAARKIKPKPLMLVFEARMMPPAIAKALLMSLSRSVMTLLWRVLRIFDIFLPMIILEESLLILSLSKHKNIRLYGDQHHD
jgi:hypothetical protein